MGFLAEIVREVEQDLAQGVVYARPSSDALGPRGSLRDAIYRDRSAGALLVEYKRVSPGRSDRRLRGRTIREFLAATRPAEPTAFSCLATRARFDGSVEDVTELARGTDRPVLFKDFVIDARQVEAAARAGASAILLIARLQTEGYLKSSLEGLAEVAHRRGLEVVLEFHTRTELSEAGDVAADVYAVNSRDLDRLTIDRDQASETLREAGRRGLRPLLGLSGVESADDAGRFWAVDADGILVGSAVLSAEDPAAFLRTLRRPLPEAHP